jgi:predicted nucleotide-binding protein
MFDFLRALGVDPIEWPAAMSLSDSPAAYIGEIVEKGLASAQAVVVVLSGDDEARLRPELQRENDPNYERQPTPQPRPNVLFEAGLAIGSQPDRTILVQIGRIRPWSDIAGRFVLHMDNRPEQRTSLMRKLKDAGCEFGPEGVDWLSTGDFESD